MFHRSLALLCLAALAADGGPAHAARPDDPGPTLGGAVAVGQAHGKAGPRLDVRLQGWLPPSLLALGPLRIGLEGAFALEGEESGGACSFGASDTASADAPAIGRACIESGVGARLAVGAEVGTRWIGRLEGGVGPIWRRALDLDDGAGADSRWSLSLVGRALGLVQIGDMLGGRWRVGLSAEASSFDAEAPAYAAGLVFEAAVID